MFFGYCCICICIEGLYMLIVYVLCCDICCFCLQIGVFVFSLYIGVIVEFLVEDGVIVKVY